MNRKALGSVMLAENGLTPLLVRELVFSKSFSVLNTNIYEGSVKLFDIMFLKDSEEFLSGFCAPGRCSARAEYNCRCHLCHPVFRDEKYKPGKGVRDKNIK